MIHPYEIVSKSALPAFRAMISKRLTEDYDTEKPDQREALRLMTEVCDYVRFNHILCGLHEELEPGFSSEGCFACLGSLTPDSGTIKLKVAP